VCKSSDFLKRARAVHARRARCNRSLQGVTTKFALNEVWSEATKTKNPVHARRARCNRSLQGVTTKFALKAGWSEATELTSPEDDGCNHAVTGNSLATVFCDLRFLMIAINLTGDADPGFIVKRSWGIPR
jgi:hypothetical protein